MKLKRIFMVQQYDPSGEIVCVLTCNPRKGLRILGAMRASVCSVEVAIGGGMQMKGGKIRIDLFPKPKEPEKKKEGKGDAGD